MTKNGRSKKEENKPGAPEWMNTYGDMVTLLLTLFVLLFAFSEVDKSKFAALIESFSGTPPSVVIEPIDITNPVQGFKVEDYVPGVKVGNGNEAEDTDDDKSGSAEEEQQYDYTAEAHFSDLYERLQAYIQENDLQGSLNLYRDGEYINLTVIEGLLFDSGQAQLIGSAQKILEDIGGMLIESMEGIHRITVEGHTDNVPISNSLYVDNWDLSTKRATNVVRYMNEHSGLPMPLFVAVGKGEWEPAASNDTEAGRRQNRRVQFIIASKNVVIKGMQTE